MAATGGRRSGVYVWMAYGTRGDVQPVACLAVHMAMAGHECTLITHLAHQVWLSEAPYAHANVSSHFVHSLPAQAWSHEGDSSKLTQPASMMTGVDDKDMPHQSHDDDASLAAAEASLQSAQTTAIPQIGSQALDQTRPKRPLEPSHSAGERQPRAFVVRHTPDLTLQAMAEVLRLRASAVMGAAPGKDKATCAAGDKGIGIDTTSTMPDEMEGPEGSAKQRKVEPPGAGSRPAAEVPASQSLPAADRYASPGMLAPASASGYRASVSDQAHGSAQQPTGHSAGKQLLHSARSALHALASAGGMQVVLVFNLFALEGYHVAQALGLPCAAVHPYLIPYRCPQAFEHALRMQTPELYALLAESDKQAEMGKAGSAAVAATEPDLIHECSTTLHADARSDALTSGDAEAASIEVASVAAGSHDRDPPPLATAEAHDTQQSDLLVHMESVAAPSHCGSTTRGSPLHRDDTSSPSWADSCAVGLAEVLHWMWPLFSERWGEWRESALQLAPLPLHHAHTDQPLVPLPHAVPLLYGVCEPLVQRMAYWGRSVHICGPWQPPQHWFQGIQLPAALQASLTTSPPHSTTHSTHATPHSTHLTPHSAQLIAAVNGPLLVDLGSMGPMGLIPRPAWTMRVIALAMERCGITALWLTGGWQPWHHAHTSLPHHLRKHIGLWSSAVHHTLLLPHVCALLHPAGSGSCMAAALAGVPQISCPLHFDQFYWAERVSYLGCGPPPVRQHHLLGSGKHTATSAPAVPACVPTCSTLCTSPEPSSSPTGAAHRDGQSSGGPGTTDAVKCTAGVEQQQRGQGMILGQPEANAVQVLAQACVAAMRPSARAAAQALAQALGARCGLSEAQSQLEALL